MLLSEDLPGPVAGHGVPGGHTAGLQHHPEEYQEQTGEKARRGFPFKVVIFVRVKLYRALSWAVLGHVGLFMSS